MSKAERTLGTSLCACPFAGNVAGGGRRPCAAARRSSVIAILRAQVAHFGVLRPYFPFEIFDASLRADGFLVGARDFFRAACQVGAEFVALA